MLNPEVVRQILRNRQLASLGDAYVNFVYSLALTQTSGQPTAIKVSDRVLAEALRNSGLREHMGTRITRKDLANASEALLVDAYRKDLMTVQESVKILCANSDGLEAGLSDLIRIAAERLSQ